MEVIQGVIVEAAPLRGWRVSPSNIFQSFYSLALAHSGEIGTGRVVCRVSEIGIPDREISRIVIT